MAHQRNVLGNDRVFDVKAYWCWLSKLVVNLWSRVSFFANAKKPKSSQTPAKNAEWSWVSYPLSMTQVGTPAKHWTCTIGDMVFIGNGTVVLGGRAYIDGAPINCKFAGCVAHRKEGFRNVLTVYVASERCKYYFSYEADWWYRHVKVRGPATGIGHLLRQYIGHYGGFFGAIFWAIEIGFKCLTWLFWVYLAIAAVCWLVGLLFYAVRACLAVNTAGVDAITWDIHLVQFAVSWLCAR
ncbi:MAG TPA: hypothetical protein VE988_00480 [Gemmataceae bacterium]|nr:hypothetical protein [Gemmataceae bacterium]